MALCSLLSNNEFVMTDSYTLLDDKVSTRFDNPASFETDSSPPIEKEFHRSRDEFDWGMQERYDKYTPYGFSRKDLLGLCQHRILEKRIPTSLSRQGNIPHW